MKNPLPPGPTLLGVAALAAVGLLAFVAPGSAPPSPTPAATCEVHYEGEPKAGVSFVAPRRPVGPEAVAPVARVGADWIAVLPYAFLGSDDELRFDRDRQWWGEGVEGVAATIHMARQQGLKVMLKPHVWAGRAGWVGDYAPTTEEGWERFEASYTEYILTFAAVAQETGAELFVVGTELDRTVRERPDLWHRVIDRVEARYDGPLTYAANWDGFGDVPFWDRMDYLGVDAFFPLSEKPQPTAAELESAWQPIVAELAAACRTHQRPILFTEFGYRSIDGSAGNQWKLPPEGRADVPPNLQTQVEAYEALFRTWWEHPWFAGGFLWKWFADDEARAHRVRADYTPQHKPVEDVIRRWYADVSTDGSP